MGYYSAIKRSAFESVQMRWMNLEPIIQSEVSHKERDKYHTQAMQDIRSKTLPKTLEGDLNMVQRSTEKKTD